MDPLKKRMSDRKIVDGFIFYNELNMLDYRLSVLYDLVDVFVLCESTRTHVGKEKPLYFQENKDTRYSRYLDKIVHIVVDDLLPSPDIEKGEQWKNEKQQRNALDRGFQTLGLTSEDDVLLISDMDEIPSPEAIKRLRDPSVHHGNVLYILEQDMYYYNLTTLSLQKWYHAVAVPWGVYRRHPVPDDMRLRHGSIPPQYLIQRGGWHLSYFGNETFIQNKIQNFTHQEFNSTEYTDQDTIRQHIEEGTDLYRRSNEEWFHMPLDKNDRLPPSWQNILPEKMDTV